MRHETNDRHSGGWRLASAIVLIVIGVIFGIVTVALFRFTEPAFPHQSCGNRFNTDGYFGYPKGTQPDTLKSHHTLIPFQMVCEWDRNDGDGVATTYIELGTWVPITAIVGLAGGLTLLLTTTKSSRASLR